MTTNDNNLPIAAECGVLVCGGGTAGVIAGVFARASSLPELPPELFAVKRGFYCQDLAKLL